MGRGKFSILIATVILLGVIPPLRAGTTVNIAGGYIEPTVGAPEVERQIQMVSDETGDAIAKGTILANLSGYPLGTAILEKFPSFFIGLSVNTALTNMRYFDSDKELPQGAYPFITQNPVINFGLGLGEGFDCLGKLFVYSDALYRPPIDFDYATLDILKIYSAGFKIRYNYIPRKIILPGLFEFAGLTFAVGGDFMYTKEKFHGNVNYTMNGITTTVVNSSPPPATHVIDGDYDCQYSMMLSWYSITANVSALVYFDVFWIFDLYTGFGLAGNWGGFKFKATGSGAITTTDAGYIADNGDGSMGTMDFISDNGYKPYYAIPIYIAGFELNLYYIRIAFQTQVNMWNRQDVTLELGCRFQY